MRPLPEELQRVLDHRVETLEAIKQLLTESLRLNTPHEAIDPDVPLFAAGLGFDSVDALELLVAVETRFSLKLEEDVVRDAFRSLNSLVDLVLAKQAEKVAA